MSKLKKFILFLFLALFIFSLVASASEKEGKEKNSLNPQLFYIPSWPVWLVGEGVLSSLRGSLLKIASDWTAPLCKSHELFRKAHLETHLNLHSFESIGLQGLKFIENARKAIVLTLPGAALRSFAANLHEAPYLHVQEEQWESKTLGAERNFTLLSWNVCFVGAGYPMSDGGVLPWKERVDAVVEKITEVNADVNCLFETFDTESAFYLYGKLKSQGYTHFYFSIGSQGIGTSSGIFIASKYAVKNPEFTLFPEESSVGRTKFAAKGVFAFDLESENDSFARIFATHLQHSEEPGFPTEEEIAARKVQMQMILNQMQRHEGKSLVLTGDLNLDDAEYAQSPWRSFFEKGERYLSQQKTWGGDEFCAHLMGKRASQALNLDHTMVFKGSADRIETRMIETGFDGAVFHRQALSDHAGLFSHITSAKK